MFKNYKSLLVGIAVGILYGLVFRLTGGFKDSLMNIMSISFLFVVPLLIGFFSIRSMNRPNIGIAEAFFLPFLPIVLGCFATYLLAMEGLICIAMYLPAGLILAGIGGLVARSKKIKQGMTLGLLVLPFATHMAENRVEYSPQNHKVKNSISIQGSPSQVWDQIKSVKTISNEELPNSWVHHIGFPRPLEAEIDVEGVDGVRTARFERGLVFVETVTDWKPNEILSFRIDIDPKDIPPTALDEHVTIGGPFFDVLNGTYQIETHADGTVTLNLESNFRLSTHFNFYAEFWTDLIMHQIQSDILSVIKQRIENSKI